MKILTRELTAKERQICQWLAEGWEIQEIAKKLFRNRSTIEAHKYRVQRKMNITNNREWMSYLRTYDIPRLTFPIETKPSSVLLDDKHP
jgi:DNA-binding NarL/FixJ family response regulator